MRPDIRYEVTLPIDRPSATLTATQFASALLLAIILVPAGAHVFALPNKIGLPAEEYMTVQRIYDGWALFGIPIVLALLALLLQTILLRRQRTACVLSALSFWLVAASQAVFWIYTFPMNEATAQWRVLPEDLQPMRLQWEYSHAAGAALVFLAYVACLASIFMSRRFSFPEWRSSGSEAARS